MPGILPEISIEESLDVTRIFSVAEVTYRHTFDEKLTVRKVLEDERPK